MQILKGLSVAVCLICVNFSAGADWYNGGSLHKATVEDWRNAEDANRLATAGDWTVALIGSQAAQALGGMDKIKNLATQLVQCIDTTVSDKTALPATEQASTVAYLCASLMRWPLKK